MTTLLYLAREEVRVLLPALGEQLDLVAQAYEALEDGRAELPPKPGIHPRPDSFIHAMPAYLRDEDVAALKWVAGYPANKERGLPYISGLIVLNDPETGLPLAVMDGAEITAARTAAASGVCIRRFAPAGWREAAILGCGEQGRFHARLLAVLNPDVHIRAYDPHPDRIEQLEGNVTAAGSWEEAVHGAEVVVSAGPIVEHPQPPIGPDDLAEGLLALPLDFDFYFRAEAVAAADLFLVDDANQFAYYRSLGHFAGWREPDGAVGAAHEPRARVLCCNLGVGVLDAVFARRVYDGARAAGTGTELPL